MNHSGDAAEQIVRMSLEGVEVAARITGTAAKEIALFLVAALKAPEKNTPGKLKTKGKARLTSMLKSGKALEIFSVKEKDLAKFAQGAKQYGIVYCVLRNTKNTPDGLCDIMVKADDAPKISRVIERFKFGTIDKAKIESEIVAAKAEKTADARTDMPVGAEPDAPDKDDDEKLVDELLATDEGKVEPERTEAQKADDGKVEVTKADPNPDLATTNPPPPSEPTFESRNKSAGGIPSKPSVKEDIREITARKKKEAEALKRDDPVIPDKQKNTLTATTHRQPQNNRKSKSKKSKGNR